MRAAGGLAHDLVDQAQPEQGAWRSGRAVPACIAALAGIAPQDRGAAFRGDHEWCCISASGAVADADRERAARAAFADHRADDRHRQFDHFSRLRAMACGTDQRSSASMPSQAPAVSMKVRIGTAAEALGQRCIQAAQRRNGHPAGMPSCAEPALGVAKPFSWPIPPSLGQASRCGPARRRLSVTDGEGAVAGELPGRFVARSPTRPAIVRPRRCRKLRVQLPRGEGHAGDGRSALAQLCPAAPCTSASMLTAGPAAGNAGVPGSWLPGPGDGLFAKSR